jgi:septum formation protein
MIKTMKQLILASASPARKEILEKVRIPFIVEVSSYEEDMGLDLPPPELAMHLSQGKARDVAKNHKNAVILGADSFAVFKDQLLGKPHTKERAKEMLRLLSGECHSFITGFTIIDTDSGKEVSDFTETKVYFNELSEKEIENYLTRENVLEKAAAYIIQGIGGVLVAKIEGDYSNVMGLPISAVAQKLKFFGIEII